MVQTVRGDVARTIAIGGNPARRPVVQPAKRISQNIFNSLRRQLRQIGRRVGPQLYPWYSSAMLDNPPRKGPETRERILAVAEAAVLAKGFAATSIEELIVAVGITKSGFFYHFKDKGELAKGLMLRYLAHDKEVLDDIFRRGDELNEDPLHGFLVGLKLFAEMMANLPEAHPGCLAASFCYQDQLFNREIRDLNAGSVLAWRKRFRGALRPDRGALSAAPGGRPRRAGRHGGDPGRGRIDPRPHAAGREHPAAADPALPRFRPRALFRVNSAG